jgi:hypothetical protein
VLRDDAGKLIGSDGFDKVFERKFAGGHFDEEKRGKGKEKQNFSR